MKLIAFPTSSDVKPEQEQELMYAWLQRAGEQKQESYEKWLRRCFGEGVKKSAKRCLHCFERGKINSRFHEEEIHQNRHLPCKSRWEIFDHLVLYRIGNEPLVLITQPYHFEHDMARALLDWCDEHGFEMQVTEYASFHYPAACVPIEIWNCKARDKHRIAYA